MRIKKIIFVFIVLGVLFGLTGCGQKGPLYQDHHQKQNDADVESEINAAL